MHPFPNLSIPYTGLTTNKPASGKKGLEPLFLILEITILPLKLFPFPWVGNYIIPPFEGDPFNIIF